MDEAATIKRIPRAAQAPDTDVLFRPFPFNLRHRIVMAPLTRDRAGPGRVPRPIAAT